MAEYGFDTLEAAEALAAAGMAEAHAKAIAVTMRKAVTQGVATSGDVRRVEDRMMSLEDRIATVEENMATKADLRRLEDRMMSLEDRMATVEENMATKADLRRLEDKIATVEDRIAKVEENGATKADLMRLQDGMTNLEVRVDNKLARLETRLVLTVFGAAGLLFAALKLFPAGAP